MSAEAGSQPTERSPAARVFFALWPAAENARQLAALAGEFARTAGGRATRPETIHLTLAFLGDVAVDRLPALVDAARAVRAAPFALTLDRCGYWSHNRLLWAGCSHVPEALSDLAGKLAEALSGAGFLNTTGQRSFTPHVTLVRKVAQRDPPVPACVPLVWPCTSFVLVRSTLTAAGPSYRPLAEFPLDGGAAAGVRPGESGS